MFGRKNRAKGVDIGRDPARDFQLRSAALGYEGYRPVSYQFDLRLGEDIMIPQIDTHLDRLFSGDVDEANANLLDSMIFSVYRVAVSDLSKQRDKHREVIDDLVARHTADEKDKRRARELAQEELNSLEKKYKEACDALDAQTNRKKKGGFKHEVE